MEQDKFWKYISSSTTSKSQMEMIQQQIISHGRSPELALQEQSLVDHILERQKQEKILWRKKSRVQWLKEGEQNTKFFHCSMIQRHTPITSLISFLSKVTN
jgi:hypothetical protein